MNISITAVMEVTSASRIYVAGGVFVFPAPLAIENRTSSHIIRGNLICMDMELSRRNVLKMTLKAETVHTDANALVSPLCVNALFTGFSAGNDERACSFLDRPGARKGEPVEGEAKTFASVPGLKSDLQLRNSIRRVFHALGLPSIMFLKVLLFPPRA